VVTINRSKYLLFKEDHGEGHTPHWFVAPVKKKKKKYLDQLKNYTSYSVTSRLWKNYKCRIILTTTISSSVLPYGASEVWSFSFKGRI
jgi:hypothetical protein